MKAAVLLGFIVMAAINPADAQTAGTAETRAATPADVASPDAIIQAVYATISGAKGAPRDWGRLRSLMVPGAVMSPTGAPKGGPVRTRVLSVDDYIAGSGKFFAEDGFYERGVVSAIWRYGHIATVRSPYESRHAAGESPFMRGVNSFQLSYDGKRWWIVSISWESESADVPLPAEEEAALRK